jgi:hypothetical protein
MPLLLRKTLVIGSGGFQDSADFLNLISFGIAFRSPSATTCCGREKPRVDRASTFILNIFVDKKQVPTLDFQCKVLKTNLSINSEQKLRQVLEG